MKIANDYKGLSWVRNGNLIEIYLSNDMKNKVFKKYYKFLGIEDKEERIDYTELVKTEIEIKEYIDKELKDFTDKLKMVNKNYDYYKQIQSQNARCRIGWFDKGEYRYLAYLKEEKKKLDLQMGIKVKEED